MAANDFSIHRPIKNNMLPSIVNNLLQALPDLDEVAKSLPKLREVKELLESAKNSSKPLTAEQEATVLRRLDRALTAWQKKKRASSQYNSLCGLYEVARSLRVTNRTLLSELDGRRVANGSDMIQQIKVNLLGTGSLQEIPPRQVELMYQVLEPFLLRFTADKLTPPLQRSVSDDALASMSDEALEALPAEDTLIASTRRLMNAILRFAKSFQQPDVDLNPSQLDQLTTSLKAIVDDFKHLEVEAYDICELIHDHNLIDSQQLTEANRSYFDYLFPTEIITIEPAEEMAGAWREAVLERQIKADMDYMLSDCVRSNPVANALMAEYAQTKELKTYEEARQLVLPEAKKKLEVRLATEILNKATDEVQQKDTIHRYPVEISEELKAKIVAGDLVAAMQLIEVNAVEMMKRFLPELYRSTINVE